MGLNRLGLGWILVTLWLYGWEYLARWRGGGSGAPLPHWRIPGEALLLTALGGLWFGSLGAGGWWLVFGLLGALREWPRGLPGRNRGRSDGGSLMAGLSGLARTLVAGGILAWRLGPV